MNLSVKRIGQLALIAVALFFFSCNDNVTPLGFQNPKDKFNIKFVEIPLESSVYLIDSIRTSNYPGEFGRLMIGKYSDPAFGTITTRGFMEVKPFNTTIGLTDEQLPIALFDSVRLEMRYDFYSYGAPGATDQTFNVHLLTELISSDSTERANNRFFSKKNDVDYDPTPIGTKTVKISSTDFKTQFDKGASGMDTTLLNIRLEDSFGQLLLTRAKLGTEEYTVQEKFNQYVKGLAVIPGDANDKVIGFDHANILGDVVQSRLVVYYHLDEIDTASRTISFNLNYRSFTNIEADRNAGNSPDLFDIPDFYVTKDPANLRYSQTGTGVVTRLDFGKFYEFADGMDQMIINSAELAITGYETPGSLYPINSFSLILLDSGDNAYRNTRYQIEWVINDNGDTTDFYRVIHEYDQKVIGSHRGLIGDASGFLTAMADNGQESMVLRRDGERFGGYMTLLAQQLYKSSGEFRYRYFGLFPIDPPNGKSINRLVFNKNNLVLRVYYTTPTQAVTN